jgi:hypothetical protein
VLSCVGRGLGAGLIPRPRSPTKYLKGSISKKENPTPGKGIRKMRKKKKKKLFLNDKRKTFGTYDNSKCLASQYKYYSSPFPKSLIILEYCSVHNGVTFYFKFGNWYTILD